MAAMAKIGEALIGTLVDRRDGGARAFVRHVDAWLAGGVSPRIEDLVAVTRLSRRQVERKCNALYGAPPKLLARKYRALRAAVALRSEEHTSELQSLMRNSYAVFCLKTKKKIHKQEE